MTDNGATSGLVDQNQLEKLLLEGGEFLKQHRVAEARQVFSQTLAIDPNNAKALGLLGLVCFRMNDFESALPVYERLVELHRNDASFALNLGLVYLKLGHAEQAIAELQRCRELDPSQSRAVSYLGLAHARNGQYADAYQAFLHAGEHDLAREMEQYLSEDERARIQASVRRLPHESELEPEGLVEDGPDEDGVILEMEPEDEHEDEHEHGHELGTEHGAVADGGDAQPTPSSNLFQPGPTMEISAEEVEIFEDEDEPDTGTAAPQPMFPDLPSARPMRAGTSVISQAVRMAVPSQAATANATKVAEGNRPPLALFEFATDKLIRPEDGEHPFELSSGGILIIRVRGRVFTRTEGVNVTGGELAYEAALRRVRGSATSEEFSTDGRQLFVVSGQGHMLAAPLGEQFTAVTLDEDILYLREDLVFAFEERLRWENGKVPGSSARIQMVQFRGHGSLAFRSKRPLVAIKLAPERVLHVDAHVLAGWIGRVIPRAVTPVAGGERSTLFVECTGEGVILVEDEGGDDESASPSSSRPILAGARRIDP